MNNRHESSEEQRATDSTLGSRVQPIRAELRAFGKSLRDQIPRHVHSIWKSPARRSDPVALIKKSNKGRIPSLIPIRHGRMIQSPFAFYRGAALNMAADLASTSATGVRVQACGDCHLLNFGAYSTPERRVIFDINDLDEALPAPWEWDVKRLAASFVLACRHNGFSEDSARDAALSAVQSYREHMTEYSEMHVLDVWYASIEAKDVLSMVEDEEVSKRIQKRIKNARERSVMEHEFPELVTTSGLIPKIKENPPLIFHSREKGHAEQTADVQQAYARYRASLQEDRRLLLDRFQLMDIAMKVVGVGSVGTYCGILLLMASASDPLFLQFKQARPSVLEKYAGKSPHMNDGQRIVHGSRMMQSASDIFLGWTKGQLGREFYVRQLKDMKIKPIIEGFTPSIMRQYAELCGWTLAHAHARSGEPAKISGYLGKRDEFDQAIADFSVAYADQSERDHEVLRKAVQKGHLEVIIEEP